MKIKIALIALLISFAAQAQKSYWEESLIKFYEDGFRLYEKQLYGAAADKFDKVMQQSNEPTHGLYVSAEYHKAMCSVYLMNKDATSLVLAFIENHPTSPRVKDAIWHTSDFMFNTRKYKHSAEWLQKLDVTELTPEEREAYHFKLGYSFFAKKDFHGAADQFYQIKDKNGKYANSAKYYYAHIAYADSNYNTALENFKPLLNDPAFGAIAPYYLAQIYYQTGDIDALLEIGEMLIEKSENKRVAEISKLVGEAYFQKKDYAKAIDYFEMHKQKGGKMRQADHYTMGYCYYKLEEYEKAIQSFNKIANGKNKNAQNAYYHLADCYVKTGNKFEAMSAFKAAAEIKNGDKRIVEDASFNYAKLNYEMANPYEDAIKALKRFLKNYPNSINKSDANKYLANLYITTKDYDNALKSIQEAGLNTAEMRAAYQKVAYFRGVEYYNSLKLDKAIGLFNESVKYPINTTYLALARYWTSEALFKQKKYAEALESISKFQATPGAINLTEYKLANYNKGYCNFMLENYGAAAVTFRLFYDNYKKQPRLTDDASLRLGDCYFMSSKYDAAINYYNKLAGSQNADGDYAQFQKSLCLGLAGKNPQKVKALKNLLAVYPNSKYRVESRFELGNTYLKMDDNQNAIAAFNKFLTDYPTSKFAARAKLNQGVIYRNMGNYNESINTFKKVVKEYPATPEANEAISFAKLVYASANRIDEYVDWVSNIEFADIKRATLDSTMFTDAYDYYLIGDCNKAQPGFEGYLNKFPEGYFVLKANYYMAECAYKNHQDDIAEQGYKAVVSLPKSEFSERSLVKLANMNYDAEDYQDALKYYEQLAGWAENVNRLRDAYVGILRSAQKLDNHIKVVQYADIILSDDKFEPEIKNEAMLLKARSYLALENNDQAWQAYTELKQKAQGAPKAEAAYYVAYFENLGGLYDSSNASIFWMIDNLPSYKSWRFNALLILADNYWKLGDAFQANYTLDFIIDENYSDEVTSRAKTLQEEIKRAEEQQKLKDEQREEDLNQIEIGDENDENLEEIEPDENREEENENNDNNPQK